MTTRVQVVASAGIEPEGRFEGPPTAPAVSKRLSGPGGTRTRCTRVTRVGLPTLPSAFRRSTRCYTFTSADTKPDLRLLAHRAGAGSRTRSTTFGESWRVLALASIRESGRDRTCDTRFRKPVLCPTELRNHVEQRARIELAYTRFAGVGLATRATVVHLVRGEGVEPS